jgi:NAD-dependent dihydropyrimidine dehydrogenase PreA subunit
VEVVEDNVDECTLCELCLKASPEGVAVKKLY